MTGPVVGRASIVIEADTNSAAFEAETVKAAEKAGGKAGKGFSTSMNKEIDKGGKDTGKSLTQSLQGVADKGFGPLLTAAATLGPALVPALAAGTVAALSLTTALAGAGAAGGIFAAVFKSSFSDLKKNVTLQDRFTTAVGKYNEVADASKKGSTERAAALKMVAENQDKLNILMAGMTAPEKAAFEGFDKMRTSWADFKALNQGQTLGIMAEGFNLIVRILPQLEPLFQAGAKGAKAMLDAVAHWVDAGGLKGLVSFLADQASTALPKFQAILGNLANAFGSLFFATAASGPGLLNWLVKLSAEAAAFGANGGFDRFVDTVVKQTPVIVAILGNLAKSLGHISLASSPLIPVAIKLSGALSALIAAIPIPVLSTLIGLFVSFQAATTVLDTALGISETLTQAVAAAQYVAAAATTTWTVATRIAYTVQGLYSLGLIDAIRYIGLVIQSTKIYTAAQWLLNVALDANPVVLLTIAIAALVAGLIILYLKVEASRKFVVIFGIAITALVAGPIVALGVGLVVAYKKSETFRDAVNAAFNAVKAVVMVVVNYITGTMVPAFVDSWNQIVTAVKVMGNAVMTAWDAVIAAGRAVAAATVVTWNAITAVFKTVVSFLVSTFGPSFQTFKALVIAVFQAIEILILAFWKLVVMPTFKLVVAGIVAAGQTFTAFWKNAVVPAMAGIGAAITAAWTKVILPTFTLLKAGVALVVGVFNAFWHTTVVPVMAGIGSAISTAWTKVITPVFAAIKTGAAAVGAAFTAVWHVIESAWSGLGSAISKGWTATINPVFAALKAGVNLVKSAFDTSVTGISTAWNKLETIAKAPVKFVIQTVLNNGLIKAFNWLGSKVGGPTIQPIPLPFARGGIMPGYTPGRDVHQFYSPTGGSLALSGGEAIMRPEFTKSMGGKSGIDRLNKLAKEGKLTGDFHNGGVYSQSFASGGVIDFIKGAATGAFNWMSDPLGETYQALSKPLGYLKAAMPSVPGTGIVTDLAEASATKLLGFAASKVTSLFSAFKGAFELTGGTKFPAMRAWIMGHLGIPYLWGGTGPRYDCSGFTQAASRAGGVSIPRTAAMQQAFAKAVGGGAIKPGDLGFLGRPAHHVEMYMGNGQWGEAPHTGDVTKVISQGLSSFDGGFGATFANGGIFNAGSFDSGGTLRPGANLVHNNTGAPEPLVPAGGTTIHMTVTVDDIARLSTVADFVDMLQGARATSRKTQRSGTVRA